MSATHTPTPWAIGFSDGTGSTYITAGDHAARNDVESVAVVVSGGTDDWGVTHGVTRPEDAAHIVRCVNAHDGLVAALREVRCASGGVLLASHCAVIDAALAAAGAA